MADVRSLGDPPSSREPRRPQSNYPTAWAAANKNRSKRMTSNHRFRVLRNQRRADLRGAPGRYTDAPSGVASDPMSPRSALIRPHLSLLNGRLPRPVNAYIQWRTTARRVREADPRQQGLKPEFEVHGVLNRRVREADPRQPGLRLAPRREPGHRGATHSSAPATLAIPRPRSRRRRPARRPPRCLALCPGGSAAAGTRPP
jgi:hypothetical protein